MDQQNNKIWEPLKEYFYKRYKGQDKLFEVIPINWDILSYFMKISISQALNFTDKSRFKRQSFHLELEYCNSILKDNYTVGDEYFYFRLNFKTFYKLDRPKKHYFDFLPRYYKQHYDHQSTRLLDAQLLGWWYFFQQYLKSFYECKETRHQLEYYIKTTLGHHGIHTVKSLYSEILQECLYIFSLKLLKEMRNEGYFSHLHKKISKIPSEFYSTRSTRLLKISVCPRAETSEEINERIDWLESCELD